MTTDITAYIAQLNRHVLRLYRQGHSAEALFYAREAYTVAAAHLSEDHPTSLASLNNLASTLQAAGQYPEAQQLFQHALTIRRATLGDDHSDVAISLNNLAGVCWAMGDIEQAKVLFENALAIWQQTYGTSHPLTTRCLQSLAALHFEMHDYPASATRLEQILHSEQTEQGDSVATVKRLALVYHRMGNYRLELPLRQRLLEIARLSPTGLPDLDESLNNLAIVHYNLGNLALAVPLYRESVERVRARAGDAGSLLADRFNNVAALLRSMGDYAQAEDQYRQAIALLANSPNVLLSELARVKTNLGELLVTNERRAEARSFYHDALEDWERAGSKDDSGLAATYNNLAQLEALEGNLGKARILYSQALTIFRSVYGNRHPDVASGLINLGELFKAMGDYPLARPLLEEALSIQRAVYGGLHPAVAQSLTYVAQLHAATGDVGSALPLLHEAAAIDSHMIGQVFSFGSERQRMEYLATLHARRDVSLSLIALLAPADAHALIAGYDLCLQRKSLGAEALMVQRDAVLGRQHPTVAAKLRELTQLRARIAQALLYGCAPGDEPAQQQQLATWNRQKEVLEAALAEQIPEMNLDKRLRAANYRAVADSLPTESVLIEFIRYTPYRFDAIRARGQYVWQPDRYLAFILPAGHPNQMRLVDLGECVRIDAEVNKWRRAVAGTSTNDGHAISGVRHLRPSEEVDSGHPLETTGQYLRQLVFDPLLPTLGGRTRLLLATDGDLAVLPFETLPNGPGRYLIDDFAISYLSTGRDALRVNIPQRRTPGPSLVIADPDYDLAESSDTVTQNQPGAGWAEHVPGQVLRGQGLRFGHLPGTRAEGELVGRLLGVTPAMGSTAVKARLTRCCSPRILHIGTHGFFLSDRHSPTGPSHTLLGYDYSDERIRNLATLENPYLRCGLALAGANTWLTGNTPPSDAENGLLTAEDVAGLDLTDTDLVVLSACDTGLGDIHSGEGVIGLRRAFAVAGARALVISLWQTPDHQTYLLMAAFYQHLLAGKPCAAALRAAQQSLKQVFPHPYYWGAFICLGDGDLTLTEATGITRHNQA